MSNSITQEIRSPHGPIHASVQVPGSKSLTQRALVAASLARGVSVLTGPLESEDTRLVRQALRTLGVPIESSGRDWVVHGQGGVIGPSPHELYFGNNGTGMRFLASVVALGQGTYRLTGTERMAERPIEPLLASLRDWGAVAESVFRTGCPPIVIQAQGLAGGETLLVASQSSQFLSSLLLVAPYTQAPAVVVLDGPLVSRPYVDLTVSVMAAFGVRVDEETGPRFRVPQGTYEACTYEVEGDASSASYFWAAAAVTGGKVTVTNIPALALQEDAAFVDLLAKMGCLVTKGEGGVAVEGPPPGSLRALDVDMGRWPDVVPTLAVIAAFGVGHTRIRNVANLRIKETDRLRAVATELVRLGARVKEMDDGLVIEGGHHLRGTAVRTYDDHRMAMAFALAGLRVQGVRILEAGCVEKSFPTFWTTWDEMIRSG